LITAVDTNILIDVFGADERFGRVSQQALKHCATKGSLIACDVVWIETATVFASTKECELAMSKIGVDFSATLMEAIEAASDAWRQYRHNGGKHNRVAADFLVAAHALRQAHQLLTRDQGFCRQYFSSLVIVDPIAPAP